MPGDLFESVMGAAGDQLLSVIVGGAVTAVVAYARWLVLRRWPARRIWRYDDGNRLVVVVAASAEIHTGEYARPTTGIGQVRAMSLLVPLLVRAYRGIDLEQVLLSSRTPGRDLEADMLTLGGPKNNEVTSMLLKAVPQLPFTVDGSSIRWQGTTYEGRAVGEQVVHDYGYIVRAPNPFAQDKRIVVVGGSHTFGTVAAARWLAENGDARNLPADVAVLVEAEVLQDGHVVRPRMLHTAEI